MGQLSAYWSFHRNGRGAPRNPSGGPGTTGPGAASEVHIQLKCHPQSGGGPQSPTGANPNAPPTAHGSLLCARAAPHRGALLSHREERSSDAATACGNREACCSEREAGRESHTRPDSMQTERPEQINPKAGWWLRGWGRKWVWLPARMGCRGSGEKLEMQTDGGDDCTTPNAPDLELYGM